MAKCFLVAVVVVVVACGGGGGGYDPSSPREPILAPGLGGSWRGTMRASPFGRAALAGETRIVVTVHGDSLTASGVCPDGSGQITTRGEDDSATWSGLLVCPVADTMCPGEVMRLTIAGFRLNATGGLDFSAAGTVAGCGKESTVEIEFSGTRT